MIWDERSWWSLDNRRLYLFKILEKEGVVGKVPTKKLAYVSRRVFKIH